MPAVKSHGSFRCDGSLRSAGCAARGGREEEDRPTDRPQSRGSQSAEGRTPASPVLAARSLPGGRPAPLRSARPAAPCAPPPARPRPPAAAPRTAPPRCRAGPLAGEGGGGVSVRGSPGVCRGEGGRRERGDAPLRPESGCGARCGCRAGPPASQRCAPEKVLLLHLSAAGKGRNRSGQWQRGVGGGCPPVHLRGGPAGCPSSPEPRFGVRSFGAAPPRGAANALTGPPSPGLGLRAPCAPRPAGSVPALLLPQPRLGRAGLDVSGRPCGAEPRPRFVAEEREE